MTLKKALKAIVKAIKPLYNLYFYIGSFLINILKLFVKPQDNLIFFISFGGKKYDDSPKAIYEEILKDNRFDKYDLVWAFDNPYEFNIPRGEKISTDTFKYFKTVLKARCWVTNSSVKRGLGFKAKKAFYFNTWHGTPIKKMGTDIDSGSKSFKTKGEMNVDIMTAQGNFEADIFSRVFEINRDKFLICGLPRNDVLADHSLETKINMAKKIGLPLDKKIILYAPTFREYERDEQMNCIAVPPIDFAKWEKSLGQDYIILFRAHYEVAKVLNVPQNSKFIFNVSSYPTLNDLMLASDMLVSDYSSIFFDYSILDRPMFHFTYDYDQYAEKRGMYFDIRDELPGSSKSEDELLEIITGYPQESSIKQVRDFRNRYVEQFGKAAKISADTIFKSIS